MTVAAPGDPGGAARVQMRGESRDASTFTQVIHQPPLPGAARVVACPLPSRPATGTARFTRTRHDEQRGHRRSLLNSSRPPDAYGVVAHETTPAAGPRSVCSRRMTPARPPGAQKERREQSKLVFNLTDSR